MKLSVFLSWSGAASQVVAEGLKHALNGIFDHRLQLWISSEDIRKGGRWRQDIATRLANSPVGIVCLTDENRGSEWLLYESGAIARDPYAKLVTYILGDQHDVKGPLAEFQATLANADDTWRLVRDVNKAIDAAERLDEPLLRRRFDGEWPRLSAELKKAQGLVYGAAERILLAHDLKSPANGLTWQQLVARCSDEILIAGWSCRNVITGHSRGPLRGLLEAGKRVEFLVFHPDAVAGKLPFSLGPVCNTADDHIVDDCATGRKTIGDFYDELEKLSAASPTRPHTRVELRGTRWFMAWSCVAVDRNKASGLLHVEVYQYNNDIARRLKLVLTSRSVHYGDFVASINAIWSHAEPLKMRAP